MTEDPDIHRRLAAQAFNSTWDLIDEADRTDDDDVAMLLSAMASRWHWSQVPDAEPAQRATGDWQVAHVCSLLGYGDLALRFALRGLAVATAEQWDGWRLASAHEGVARAYATLGNGPLRATHAAEARSALERETDEGDRAAIEAQLATVPPII